MNFEELLNAKKIDKIEKEKDIDFESSEKDIKSSKEMFETGDFEWAITIAYNSVVRAGRNLMFFMGYRPIGKEHHKNLFEFLKRCDIDLRLVNYFDRIRIKRNEFLYRDVENISQAEAEETIKLAGILVQKIRTFVHKNRT